ncbi:N-acetyltransferase family protein [Nocardia farcinica]
MSLPEIVLTEYAQDDRAILEQWWEDKVVRGYLGPLDSQLRDKEVGWVRPSGERIARPTLRWMAKVVGTGGSVGYVSVEVAGQSGPNGSQSPVNPPFEGSLNIVVDPLIQCKGIGTAMLRALLEEPAAADLATLGGWVHGENAGGLGMLKKQDNVTWTTEERGRDADRQTWYGYTIPGPAARPQ